MTLSESRGHEGSDPSADSALFLRLPTGALYDIAQICIALLAEEIISEQSTVFFRRPDGKTEYRPHGDTGPGYLLTTSVLEDRLKRGPWPKKLESCIDFVLTILLIYAIRAEILSVLVVVGIVSLFAAGRWLYRRWWKFRTLIGLEIIPPANANLANVYRRQEVAFWSLLIIGGFMALAVVHNYDAAHPTPSHLPMEFFPDISWEAFGAVFLSAGFLAILRDRRRAKALGAPDTLNFLSIGFLFLAAMLGIGAVEKYFHPNPTITVYRDEIYCPYDVKLLEPDSY
jgi:hypothetical protein